MLIVYVSVWYRDARDFRQASEQCGGLENADTLFRLTPTLSLRERGNRSRGIRESEAVRLFERRHVALPLPEGEGRGEAEERVRISEAALLQNMVAVVPRRLSRVVRPRCPQIRY